MFKEGDFVTIRNWEDMESEFGLTKFGNIPVTNHVKFIARMRELCGHRYEIKGVFITQRGVQYYLRDAGQWTFVEEMFEEGERGTRVDIKYDSCGFLDMIGGGE